MNFHKIQNPWIVWYHNPSDTDWSRNSYKDIIEITSIEMEIQYILNGKIPIILKEGIGPLKFQKTTVKIFGFR